MGKLDILAKTLHQKSVLESIQISNFKAIQDKPLTLNNLTNVNYLVGENGSGKSSVLNLLELFSLSNSEIKIINGNLFVDLKSYAKKEFLKFNSTITLENVKCYLTKSILKIEDVFFRKVTLTYRKENDTLEFGWNSETNEVIKKMNTEKDARLYFYQSKIIFQSALQLNLGPEYLPDTFKYKELLIRKFIPNLINISEKTLQWKNFEGSWDALSHGQLYLIHLLNNIYETTAQYNKDRVEYVIIEEPENFLHPRFQKLIPEILKEFPNLQFLISTHSPFIISAAGKIAEKERLEGKDPSQKVYLIEDGQTRNLFGELGKGSRGYAGGDCINVVNEMLGSDLSDYFGGLCFLAEKSVCAFLMGLKENVNFKDKIKPFTFILSNKGDESGKVRQSEQMRNQAYSYSGIGNFKVILDKDVDQNFWKPYQDQFPDHWVLLDRDEIEPLYGQKVINSFLSKVKNLNLNYQDNPNQVHAFKEFCKTSSLEDKLKIPVGKLKVELGEFAGENIDENTFKTNFGDLADLIFNQIGF